MIAVNALDSRPANRPLPTGHRALPTECAAWIVACQMETHQSRWTGKHTLAKAANIEGIKQC